MTIFIIWLLVAFLLALVAIFVITRYQPDMNMERLYPRLVVLIGLWPLFLAISAIAAPFLAPAYLVYIWAKKMRDRDHREGEVEDQLKQR